MSIRSTEASKLVVRVRCKSQRGRSVFSVQQRPGRGFEPREFLDDSLALAGVAPGQLGFGYGTHACAGQGLARMETQAMLRALVQRVDRIELTAAPTWALNNIIRRHERLPLKLIAT